MPHVVQDFYDTEQIKSYHHKHAASLDEFNRKYGDKVLSFLALLVLCWCFTGALLVQRYKF